METKKKRTINIILKISIIVAAIIGIISQQLHGLLIYTGHVPFMYFTTQSNILVAVCMGILLYYDLTEKEVPRWVLIFQHITVTAVTLTFLVFAIFLGPFIPDLSVGYFYSVQNLTLHNIVPILAISQYLYDDNRDIPKYAKYLGLSSGFIYVIFVYIVHLCGATFGATEFPYFFLDYKEFGWLTINEGKIGIIYWWIVIILLLLGISALLYYLKKKSAERKNIPVAIFNSLIILSIIFIIINIIIKI
ncbi:MAG: hypothetical protein BWX57_00863 [Tenericutes bacterium ADurb.Bin024]|nr:MAG: hypothetical protein BWX57_00863 [Tenericutes bacterium ADurb.Bin024]